MVSKTFIVPKQYICTDQRMFIQVTDEDGGASVGKISSEWSSGKQKLVALTQYLCTKQRV